MKTIYVHSQLKFVRKSIQRRGKKQYKKQRQQHIWIELN